MKATPGTFYSFLSANLRTTNPTILLLINLNEPDPSKGTYLFTWVESILFFHKRTIDDEILLLSYSIISDNFVVWIAHGKTRAARWSYSFTLYYYDRATKAGSLYISNSWAFSLLCPPCTQCIAVIKSNIEPLRWRKLSIHLNHIDPACM